MNCKQILNNFWNLKFCGINQLSMKNFFNIVGALLIRFLTAVSGLVMILSGWSMLTGYFNLISILSFVISTIVFISTLYWIGKNTGEDNFFYALFSVFQ
jgi:hypothetical protein